MNQETSAVVAVLVLGFIAGILSGMFGIGGGLVIVPALVILFGLPLKMATGTSLFALMWPVGLLGVIAYWQAGQMDAWRGGLIAVGLFFGAYLGARITLALPPSTMKRFYAAFLLLVGVYMLLQPTPKEKPKAVPSPSPSGSPLSPPDPGQVH